MIKVENIEVWGFEHAIRGMRNPLNSWGKSDSIKCYANRNCPGICKNNSCGLCVGDADLNLMKRLFNAGTEHRKYLRQIFVSMDIVAPLYWWKEADTYKVGTTSNSCSTMHKIHAKEFTLDDFYSYNYTIGGQSDWSKWGRASVEQRKCEWVEIWNYINSDSLYSEVLRNDLTGTDFAYFVQGMQNWHSYMQKSGWTEDTPYYPAAGEAAIIDDSFILIVLTEDYTDYKMGHIDVIQSIGGAVETYWDQNDGYIF